MLEESERDKREDEQEKWRHIKPLSYEKLESSDDYLSNALKPRVTAMPRQEYR